MKQQTDNIITRLFELQDLKYKAFSAGLLPTVNPDRIIGIRTPALRRLAKELCGCTDADRFLKSLPHFYYEENNLHAFLIELITDFDKCIAQTDRFLPFVDNWGTCDSLRPKCFKSNKDKLLKKIKEWLNSNHTYTVRFGIEMLMVYFMDTGFSPEYPEWVAKIKSDEYYVNMMIAWYFATALAKQYDTVLPFITEKRLDKWVHNKTIQKAIESYRLNDEQKAFLKSFKVK